MNLLFITHYTGMGGANVSMLNLIQQYRFKDISVYVILPIGGDGRLKSRLKELGAEYKEIRMPWWVCSISDGRKELSLGKRVKMYLGNLRGTLQILPWIYRWHIDIVHTNSTVLTVGVLAAKITKRFHVWHLREALSFYKWDFVPNPYIVRKIFGCSDRVILISEKCKKIYEQYLSTEQMRVVYNGASVEKKKDVSENLDESFFHILYCGGMSESKGCWDI